MPRLVDRSELGCLTAVETADRIASGELKTSEAVAAAIDRAARLAGELGIGHSSCVLAMSDK